MDGSPDYLIHDEFCTVTKVAAKKVKTIISPEYLE